MAGSLPCSQTRTIAEIAASGGEERWLRDKVGYVLPLLFVACPKK